jgi:hypothetical protein
MTAEEKIRRGFLISVRQVPDAPNTYQISYMPRGLQQERGFGGRPKRVPEFSALIHIQGDDASVQWRNQPSDAHANLDDFTQDARSRVRLLSGWLRSLSRLIETVRGWSHELGWSTKQIDKPMEDPEIGTYSAPALLLQEESTRMLLEPIARSAPGAEGLVDLYLMPAYDDIASLYFYDNRWNLHYTAPGRSVRATIREAESRPLTKASLKRVVDEMKTHAE